MKIYLTTRWFGTFLHDGARILNYKLFPKNEVEIARRLERLMEGEVLDEEEELVKGEKEVIVGEKRLLKIANYRKEEYKEIEIDPSAYGFSKDILWKASLILSEKKVNDELGRMDLQIIQMVKSLDELIKFLNLLSERESEWKKLSFQDKSIQILLNLKKAVEKSIEDMEEEIKERMLSTAPNLSKIAGHILGARLIALAGGIEKLARAPSSKIQILGAEKALFRYKSGRGTPPKHGLIFQHPLIHKAKVELRGKVARLLANEISMAVKADAFTKRDISEELKERLERKMKELLPTCNGSQ